MTVLLTILRAVGWRGAIVAVAVAIGAWWHLSAVSEANERGKQTVRLEWADANRRAELAALERQKQQQVEINRVEIDLLNSRAASATRIRSLEEALEAERRDNEKNGVDLSKCRLSDRMREQLLFNRP